MRRLGPAAILLALAAVAPAAERVEDLEAELDARLDERRTRSITLAELYETSGNWRRAAEHYEQARRVRDDDARVLVQLSRLYRAHDEHEKLLSVYATLSRLQPTSVVWLRELGSCHFKLGQRQAAEAAWGRILDVQPSKTYALRHLIDVYADHGLHKRAAAACREALALTPRDQDIRLRLAEALGEGGDPLGALATLSHIAKGRIILRSQRGVRIRHNAFARLAMPDPVHTALDKRLDAGPCTAADLAALAAELLDKASRPADALPFLRRLARDEPGTPRGQAAAARVRGQDPKTKPITPDDPPTR